MASLLYYVNCNGAGHWQVAASILKHITTPAIIIAQYKPDHIILPARHQFIALEPIRRSDDTSFASDALHIAPKYHAEYLPIIQKILDIIARHRCIYAMLDVSVEMGMLLRLCGIAYATKSMHGIRTDRGHTQYYLAADALIASYPEILEDDLTPSWVKEKTHYVGGICHIQDHPPMQIASKKPVILIVKPQGSSSLNEQKIITLSNHITSHYWIGIGFSEPSSSENCEIHGHVTNASAYMRIASIMVANAGNNSILEAGYYHIPLIVKAEPRYFDEHERKVAILKRKHYAIIVDDWPDEIERWKRIIEETECLENFSNHVSKDGSKRAAQFIESRITYYTNITP